MAKKFDLDAMLANGELTQEQYDAHMKRRERGSKARDNGSNGGKVHVGNGSKTKRVSLTEEQLIGWYSELTMLQGQCENGDVEMDDVIDGLKSVADGIMHNVNERKVRLPEIEEALSDAEIALAEAQLIYARKDAEHTKARRQYGVESEQAATAGAAAQAAYKKIEELTKVRNEAKKEHFLASR